MEVVFTPEEQRFRAELRVWLQRVLPEVWEGDAPPERPTEDEEYAMRRRFDRALYRDGWAGLSWPKEYGGRGGTLTEQMIFAEETVAAGAPEHLFNRSAIGVVGPAIIDFGTEEQKQRYLPKILSCDEVWCQGFSEPNAGSDLVAIATRAVRADGGWRISGQKVWTTLGRFADFCFLLARTSDEERRHRGLSMLIVPMRQPGVTQRPIVQITGETDFSEVFFDDAFAPAENVIGEVGDGWNVAMTTLGHERSTHFMPRQVRLGREVTELVELVRANAAAVPPGLLDRVVDVVVRAEALRWTVWSHVARHEAGEEAGPPDSATKLYWSVLWQDVTQLALEVEAALGVRGRARERYLEARPATIYAGTSEIQKNIVAERGLGLPR
jgi:alkylation response protein AidB-like acyl-CoA dehydrogenase